MVPINGPDANHVLVLAEPISLSAWM